MTPQDGREEIEAEIARLEDMQRRHEQMESDAYDSWDRIAAYEHATDAEICERRAAALRRQLDSMGEKERPDG